MSQYYTDENEASDGTDGIQALGAELTDDDAPVVEETPEEQENTAEAKKEAKASSKTPVPEGYAAPVEFARMCDPDMKPQVMYGYVKNNAKLKELLLDRGEGVTPQKLIPIEEGKAWWAEISQAKAAKASAAAQATQSDTTDTVPPVEG
jgi:hypothetical protein